MGSGPPPRFEIWLEWTKSRFETTVVQHFARRVSWRPCQESRPVFCCDPLRQPCAIFVVCFFEANNFEATALQQLAPNLAPTLRQPCAKPVFYGTSYLSGGRSMMIRGDVETYNIVVFPITFWRHLGRNACFERSCEISVIL